MAVLIDQDRVDLQVATMRSTECPGGISKVDLRAAINAIDDWVDNNAAAFNAAIPQPARGSMSARQKAMLLMKVVSRRFEVS